MADGADSERRRFEQLLDSLYAARIGGELGPLLRLFAEDARFRISGSSDGKPIAISAQGETQIGGWLAVLLKSFNLSRFEVLSRVIDGRQAAVHWRVSIHSRITGASVATELIDVVEMRAGKVGSYVEFFAPM